MKKIIKESQQLEIKHFIDGVTGNKKPSDAMKAIMLGESIKDNAFIVELNSPFFIITQNNKKVIIFDILKNYNFSFANEVPIKLKTFTITEAKKIANEIRKTNINNKIKYAALIELPNGIQGYVPVSSLRHNLGGGAGKGGLLSDKIIGYGVEHAVAASILSNTKIYACNLLDDFVTKFESGNVPFWLLSAVNDSRVYSYFKQENFKNKNNYLINIICSYNSSKTAWLNSKVTPEIILSNVSTAPTFPIDIIAKTKNDKFVDIHVKFNNPSRLFGLQVTRKNHDLNETFMPGDSTIKFREIRNFHICKNLPSAASFEQWWHKRSNLLEINESINYKKILLNKINNFGGGQKCAQTDQFMDPRRLLDIQNQKFVNEIPFEDSIEGCASDIVFLINNNDFINDIIKNYLPVLQRDINENLNRPETLGTFYIEISGSYPKKDFNTKVTRMGAADEVKYTAFLSNTKNHDALKASIDLDISCRNFIDIYAEIKNIKIEQPVFFLEVRSLAAGHPPQIHKNKNAFEQLINLLNF